MNNKRQSNLKTFIIYAVVIAIIVAVVSFLVRGTATEQEKLQYSDIVKYFKEEKVEKFTITNEEVLEFYLKEEPKKKVEYSLDSSDYFREDLGEVINEQLSNGILQSYEYEPEKVYPIWVSFIPYILLIVAFVVLYVVMINKTVGKGGRMNSFGKARVKTNQDTKEKVLFADVAGADEEKEELQEIVEFLKNPQKYAELGAKIPHGVLLMGPPGTGKTLLAKAVAGEADVPFFSISGSDFVEMYVGVGASRVRDLFENARKSPASIVFIDEIDAVGRHRGAGLGGGHDEREQTLNQLLVEMDGFGAHDGIIVMAATNRPDILDPALLRPGRFDRQITVNYPDIKGREEILKVHARNKKFEKDVDFKVVAGSTAGCTGADLANLLNEAALLAVRRGKKLIGMDDIEDAYMKILVGPQKKSRKMPEREKKNTAFHEAGHAVVGFYLPTCDPVHSISIIPAGRTLGVTVSFPAEDKFSVYRTELVEQISMLLGGRVAEQLTFGDFSGGASNDIKRATEIAHRMVTELGMSDVLGPVKYGSGGGEVFLGRDFSSTQAYSDKTAEKIDEEVQRIINEAYEVSKKLLTDHADKLKFVAEYLVSHETMDGDQFKAAMEGENPTVEELEKMAAEKKERSRKDNRDETLKKAKADAKRDFEERVKSMNFATPEEKEEYIRNNEPKWDDDEAQKSEEKAEAPASDEVFDKAPESDDVFDQPAPSEKPAEEEKEEKKDSSASDDSEKKD